MSWFSSNRSADGGQEKEVKTGVIAIRGRSLVIGNEIYQISNISTLSVADLSAVRPIPRLWLILVGVGVLCALIAPYAQRLPEWLTWVGWAVAAVGALGWLYAVVTRRVSRFALIILMNAGNRMIILANDQRFLKGLAIALNNAIAARHPTNLTVNLDQRQIFDNIKNSVIVTGNVSGDIANEV